ncbi:uncharacterized protein K02A2.6-like [Plutella xylostella]|uniref:uncharacterized protein K02A2.6-like n=1 Tax=Plutella xylostella TaxID=51655 RepID=UPI002032BA45|nr:uncharacterized protein K02A2.6-like [Plutella xylostella]
MERLEAVLKRLQEAGLRLQQQKCEFFRESVTYLGFVIDKNGLRTCPKKVEAITKCPPPTNVREIKRFLGMINYYRKFIPNASTILSPLNELVCDDVTWEWGHRQQAAFDQIRRELTSDRVLTHFDPAARLVLTVDAGPAGLGACLAQGPDGQERPLAFASRTLSASEKNYSQIQKEATAIIYGVKYFHQYLYGRDIPFVLKTDHKPLIAIFGKKNGVSVMAASRLQRYAIYLSAYNYVIQYLPSEKNIVADYFSRAPLPVRHTELEDAEDAAAAPLHFLDESTLPVSVDDVRTATAADRTLQTVIKYMLKGWPRKVTCAAIQPYFRCKSDLEVEDGCLLRGHRVVIPSLLRERLMYELHKGHFGIVKTKSSARSRMWWPYIDKDIEQCIGNCSTCTALRPAPPSAAPAPWPRPPGPWWRIHIDYMTIGQRVYLIVVDAFSKWLECFHMSSGTSTQALISKLKYLFSRFGLVKVICSDNDAKIKTVEFRKFCDVNGIEHVTSPIYHPASNGQAENSVRTCKKMLKCILSKPSRCVDEDLLGYLFQYRNTVHCATGLTPAKLMYGRDLRCRLDLVVPAKNTDNTRNRFLQLSGRLWFPSSCFYIFVSGV